MNLTKLLILVAVTFVLGFYLGGSTGVVPHGHEETKHMDHHDHSTMLDWELETAPNLDLQITKDAVSGWNVQILVDNFEFSPERASAEHVSGEGHAHLYVDGEKVARVYGEWYHLSNLEPGEHMIMATLNSNSHEDYTLNGEKIMAMKKITVE